MRTPNRRGMALIELMIAMTILTVLMASLVKILGRQTKSLDKNSADMGMVQNLGFASTVLQQELSLAGAGDGMPDNQPPVVYAGPNAFILNADYASNTDSVAPVFYNPGLPTGQVLALTAAQRFSLPGTSPAFSYPDSNYYARGSTAITSPAETISWYFALDTSTAVSNDYVLFRQVNNQAPEPVVRNVMQTTGTTFFRYYYQRMPATGSSTASLDTIPSNLLPLKHSVGAHGTSADTGSAAKIDSVARVEVRFSISTGDTAMTTSRMPTQSIAFSVPLPNVGTRAVVSCGYAPLAPALSAAWVINTTVVPVDTSIVLTWTRSVDEASGERDVRTYVIWRKAKTATLWGEPIASVAAGPVSPSWTDYTAQPVAPGYDYAIAAQDCTPSLSTMSTSSPIISP
jgi:prepilin-type N-terminal cleavage/methylation domain-containing protein